jgi:type VI protein secretion system component VasF
MSPRRTRAEHNQARKLAFIPMWPLAAAFLLVVVVGYFVTR